ncbi:hypothetical protein [Pseudomonas coleopterorum]|uniref:hypothetical protein n=1 Tax=Pseudomonas coleopterorum TaxID=1605838 RepID=UPI0008956195|nr:hypothetical protein [Pseudomonas coleopterorum]SEE39381.1 hypothetical protein SAMN05216510_2447 [Pseudomonas coleopterorum]
MTDYSELKRLAEAATPGPWSTEANELYWLEDGYTKHLMETFDGSDICHDAEHPDNLKFIAAANPAAVLDLISEVEVISAYLCTCPDCGGEGEIFTGSYSYFGHMDPPEPNMDKCVECDGKGLIGTPQNLQTVIAERDQLKAEVEALRKDAERYRHLRNGAYCVATIDGYRVICEEPMPGPFVDADSALDASIDAAMSKESGHD